MIEKLMREIMEYDGEFSSGIYSWFELALLHGIKGSGNGRMFPEPAVENCLSF